MGIARSWKPEAGDMRVYKGLFEEILTCRPDTFAFMKFGARSLKVNMYLVIFDIDRINAILDHKPSGLVSPL